MRRLFVFTISTVFAMAVHAQDFFDQNTIHNLKITFEEENWDYLLDSMAQAYNGTGTGQGRLVATVEINGTVLDSCGVRFKGNSSYSPGSNKNPWNIDLNYVISGQDYQGVDKIKLANESTDQAFIREPLMYDLAEAYMHVPRANYTKVWVNEDYKGLYVNTEDIGNEFLDARFGDSHRPFFKCDPVSIEVLGADNSNLTYYADTMEYVDQYDMKSDFGLEALQELTYQLEFDPSNIEEYLDVDRALWFHALSNIFVHLDGYMAFAHNYYLYKDRNDRWNPILWDVNLSFGGLLWDGSNIWPLNSNQLKKFDPLHQIGANDARPFIANLLQQPRFYKMYMAHYKTIKEENLDNDYYFERAQYWHALADTIMEYEPYPHHPYAQFQNNLYTNVGNLFTLSPGIESLMEGRKSYLDTLDILNQESPLVEAWSSSTESPSAFESVSFTADVDGADTVFFGFRSGVLDKFTKVQMYDDGMHGDGSADDGTYGVSITTGLTDMQYYFYAENSVAGTFSPARAEHEFHLLPVNSSLVLNEVQSNNQSTQMDQDMEFDDWIELYNNGDQPVDLSGYYLSDDSENPLKWAFPDTTIYAQEFLIVWADDQSDQAGLHADFKLSGLGDNLLFTSSAGAAIDQVELPAMLFDQSYGRIPNGTGPWELLQPTFSANNESTLTTRQASSAEIPSVYPVPSQGIFNLTVPNEGEHILTVFAIDGKQVGSFPFKGNAHAINLTALSPGLYLFKIDEHVIRAVKQ